MGKLRRVLVGAILLECILYLKSVVLTCVVGLWLLRLYLSGAGKVGLWLRFAHFSKLYILLRFLLP